MAQLRDARGRFVSQGGAKVKWSWRGASVGRKVENGMERNLQKALELMRNTSIHLVSRGGGVDDHSAPGEAPKSITGFLRQRINVERDGLTGKVGTGVGGGQNPMVQPRPPIHIWRSFL